MADELRPFITITRRTLRWGEAAVCLSALAVIVALVVMFVVYQTGTHLVDKSLDVNQCRAQAGAAADAVLLETVAGLVEHQPVDAATVRAAATARRASVNNCETAKENP